MKIIFLDLEETLVNSWDDLRLCNSSKVSCFLDSHRTDSNPLDIVLFPFAVYDDKDVDYFNANIKDWLEEKYNIRFTLLTLRKHK